SHRPSDGLEIQNQLICCSPSGWGAAESCVAFGYSRNLKNLGGTTKWFSARHGFATLSRQPVRVNVINTLRRLLNEDPQNMSHYTEPATSEPAHPHLPK